MTGKQTDGRFFTQQSESVLLLLHPHMLLQPHHTHTHTHPRAHWEGLLRLTEPDEKSSHGVVLSTIPREMADSTSSGCARPCFSGSPSMLGSMEARLPRWPSAAEIAPWGRARGVRAVGAAAGRGCSGGENKIIILHVRVGGRVRNASSTDIAGPASKQD
jgi:hypothetical protein